MIEEKFSSELRLRLDWSELDIFGHINNVMYFKYLQAARVHFWDQTGLTESYKTRQLGAMLLSTHCEFKQPLFYPGNIHIKTRISFIKTTSFGLIHHLFNDKNELCSLGEDVIVIYDYSKHSKTEIPDWLETNMQTICIR